MVLLGLAAKMLGKLFMSAGGTAGGRYPGSR